MEHSKIAFRYQTKEEYYDEKMYLEDEIFKIEIKIAEKINWLKDYQLETQQLEQKFKNYKRKSILYMLLEIILVIIVMTSLFGSLNLFVFIPAFFGAYMIPIKTLYDGLSLHKKLNGYEADVETRRAQLNLEDKEILIHKREDMAMKWKALIDEMNLFLEKSDLESDMNEEVKSADMARDSEEPLEVSPEENAMRLVLRRKNNE